MPNTLVIITVLLKPLVNLKFSGWPHPAGGDITRCKRHILYFVFQLFPSFIQVFTPPYLP